MEAHMTMTDEEYDANFPSPQPMLDELAKAGVSEMKQLQALLEFQTNLRWGDFGWHELSDEGNTLCGYQTVAVEQVDEGRWSATMRVITEDPSGAFYKWTYDRALTETSDSSRYDTTVTEVLRTEVQTVVVKWVAK